MSTLDIPDFSRPLLKGVDNFLQRHARAMRCSDVHEMYHRFF